MLPVSVDKTSAIPPENFTGSLDDWKRVLVVRGLWDESSGSWHGDVLISHETYLEILEECEKKSTHVYSDSDVRMSTRRRV